MTMSLIIDPGTMSGWSIFDDGELVLLGQTETRYIADVDRFMRCMPPKISSMAVPGPDGFKKARVPDKSCVVEVFNDMAAHLLAGTLDVAVEGQFVGNTKGRSTGNALIKLCRIAEMWRTAAYYHNRLTYPTIYLPSQWQGPMFAGMGAVSLNTKEKSVTRCRQLYWATMPKSWHNAADAVLMGRHHINRTKETT